MEHRQTVLPRRFDPAVRIRPSGCVPPANMHLLPRYVLSREIGYRAKSLATKLLPWRPLREDGQFQLFARPLAGGNQMTESKKLFALREKLVSRRREIVDSFQTASLELFNGDTVAQIQDAIDAVDRAIADEKRAESTSTDSRRLVSSASPGGA
jgi:hypothetical protein